MKNFTIKSVLFLFHVGVRFRSVWIAVGVAAVGAVIGAEIMRAVGLYVVPRYAVAAAFVVVSLSAYGVAAWNRAINAHIQSVRLTGLLVERENKMAGDSRNDPEFLALWLAYYGAPFPLPYPPGGYDGPAAQPPGRHRSRPTRKRSGRSGRITFETSTKNENDC